MRSLRIVKLLAVTAVALMFLATGCATLYQDRDSARSTIERAREAIAKAEASGAPAGNIENAKAHLEVAVKELNFCRPIPARAAAERALAALGGPVAPPTELVERLVFENDVFFDFDRDELKPKSVQVLGEILDRLNDNSTLVVRLAGHTDWTGPDVYNMDLSRRRALAVARWLSDHGISISRISSSWYGESRPRTTNETREGRAINRRTEIDLVLLP